MFLSFTGCDEESFQENGESYNLTYDEKFHIVVDALAGDSDSVVELSDTKLSHLTSFTQDSELTQDTHLDSLPDTQQFVDRPVQSSIDVSSAFVLSRTDGMLPGLAERIHRGNKKKNQEKV